MYETIKSPVTIGTVTLKNRIVFAPTSMGMKEEQYIDKISELAAGGTGLIIIGDVPVLKSPFRSLYSKKGFAFYQKTVSAAHAHGAKICAQLHMSDSDIKGMIKYIPGVLTKRISMEQLRILLNEQVSGYITSLPPKKIAKIIEGFGSSAQLAGQAGFDLVQVHGDRMCGSFASSLLNHRTDGYGGSLSGRLRFAVEAVEAVKRQAPGMTVDFKLAVRQENPHYGNAGILVEELKEAVPLLEQAGVDSFHVALANHSKLTDIIPPAGHPYFKGEGCFLNYCDQVRRYTDLPVCGVGGLSTPDFVEEQLASGRIQLAAMSRGLIADPEWVNKVSGDNKAPLRRCIRCNKACLGGIQSHRGVSCIYDNKQKENGHE